MQSVPAIGLYCGIGERQWNHHPVACGAQACISPVVGNAEKRVNAVAVPADTEVFQDSGAYSDACLQLKQSPLTLFALKQARCSFKEALRRQEDHAVAYGYARQIKARASYDVLIDETWTEDEATGLVTRMKKRWSETEAEAAVLETVAAAAYLNKHRNGIACIMSAQGVSARQYLTCAQKIIPYLWPGDIFGLGGWCITGRMPAQMMPVFRETMHLVIPFLGQEGITRAHIWGVCYTPALGELLWLCDQYGIQLSTDSVGPAKKPTQGQWGYGSWRMKDGTYTRPDVLESCQHVDSQGKKVPTCTLDTYCRGLERARHVTLTREWLADFRVRETRYYRYVPMKAKPIQLTLTGLAS